MERLLKIVRLTLPPLLGLVAAALKIRAGQGGVLVVLVLIGGALLGWSIALVLESVALLVGQGALSRLAPAGDQPLLEREKENVLRAIKEVELDVALKKIEASEAGQLIAPLRERALVLLRELDEERVKRSSTIEEQIAEEVTRRLGASREEAP